MHFLNDKVTILVNSCDAYSDIWPLFFSAIKNYWPNHINIVLNSETLKYEYTKGIETHLLDKAQGNQTWGFRLRETLKDINTKYVLTLFDDFILEDNIDEQELDRIINKMENDESISVVYLTKLNISKLSDATLFENKTKNKYAEIPDKVDFRLNSAPAIWRVKDLLDFTGEIEDPWTWEVFGSYKTFKSKKKFFCVERNGLDIFNYNYEKGGAIYRGKWVEEVVVEKNEKYNLNINFNKRGFSKKDDFEKRNLKWKINFLITGYRMLGIKFVYFIISVLKRKIKS